jgi:hypothetical protein
MEGELLSVSERFGIGHQTCRLSDPVAIEFLAAFSLAASDMSAPRTSSDLTGGKLAANITPMRSSEYISRRAACCRSHNAMLAGLATVLFTGCTA